MKYRRPSFKNTPLLRHDGQVAVLVIILFSFLFLLSAMVINIGMVIHHKINLQNAADMAAYSGAAEQARILTTIGWKNYELRKNVKELVYLYWAKRSAFNAGFPTHDNAPLPQGWTPVICNEDVFNNFDSDPSDKYQFKSFSSICGFTQVTMPQIHRADIRAPIVDRIFYKQLEDTILRSRSRQCPQFGQDNFERAFEYKQIFEGNYNAILSQIHDLTYALNKERDDTHLEVYNHHEFETTLPAQWLGDSIDPETGNLVITPPTLPKDIGVIAKQTALKNLTERNRLGRFVFEPLHPQSYLSLSPIERNYFLAYMNFISPKLGECYPEIKRMFLDNFVVGIKKKKGENTYYAVRLKSEPWLPFLPGKTRPKLIAYAAAKPFGGRIAPEREDPLYDYGGGGPGDYRLPNVSLYPGDTQGVANPQTLYRLSPWAFGYKPGASNTKRDVLQKSDRVGRSILRAPSLYDKDLFTFNLNSESNMPNVKLTDHPYYLMSEIGNYMGFYNYPIYNPDQLKTGWNNRTGYSVKFVPFQELLKYDNPPSLPSDAENILH
ncbi:MAG: Tad domain-containing protein [Deltaproteobacteria bacterium]|nr:Tad domain-containing protein [Deltaproteobacteria bacterium]